MGGNSTSKNTVLHEQKTQKSPDFDLQNWFGLTEVLKRGKSALKSPSEYAQFRNLILQYSQSGGDVAIKKQIIAILESFGTESDSTVSETSKEASVKAPDLVARIVPVSHSEPTTESSYEEKTHDIADESPAQTRRLLPNFSSDPVDEQIAEVPVVYENPLSILTESTIEVEKEIAAVQNLARDLAYKTPPTISEPIPSPEDVLPADEVIVSHSIQDYKVRIADIKNLVHSKYGNPASLMNLHNGVGQTYMKALLLAMKSVGPGSEENANLRMKELEVAYATLMESEAVQVKPSAAVVKPSVEHTPEVQHETVVDSIAPTHEEEVPDISYDDPTFSGNEEIIKNEEEILPIPEFSPAPEEVPNTTEKITSSVSLNEYKNSSDSSQDSDPAIPRMQTLHELSSRSTQIRNTENRPLGFNLNENEKNETVEDVQQSIVPESIRQKHVYQNRVAQVTGVVDMAVKQSELVSEDISIALRRLLHDWSIFEGSGLFGIGPGGTEHPLYKKLAPLSMGEVMAGRWEKSDPQITRTIKDYVDAWRHEQGIAFTPDETFEHYLRRVIQRIIRRQTP